MFVAFLIRFILIMLLFGWLISVAVLMSLGLWYWGIPLFAAGVAGVMTVMDV